MSYLTRFNDTFIEMIDDLVDTFPSDGEMRLYQIGLKAAISADPNMICSIFYNNVSKVYESKIMKKDEQFFLNNSYDELSSANTDIKIDTVISKIKNRWNELSDDNKYVIWRYLQVLVAFSKKVNE